VGLFALTEIAVILLSVAFAGTLSDLTLGIL
jgi:hypothetical protein